MNSVFRKIGLAIAISPTAGAMLAEANRLASLTGGELVLIHVGEKNADRERQLKEIITQASLTVPHRLVWRSGSVRRELLAACEEENIDLLVAGALKREQMVKHYIGSVARTIMRKASCSVFMVLNPSVTPKPIQQIVVNAEDSPHIEDAISVACQLAELDDASWVHIVRELKLLGLTLSANAQCTEQEYNESKQEMVREEVRAVEEILARLPQRDVKVNVKMLSGKSGFELCKFVERKEADLLVVGAPPQRLSLFDRIFPHDLEYVFADMPCNLLVVNKRADRHG